MKTAENSESRSLNTLQFSILAIIVGIVAGLGAVIFRGMISFFHNLLFREESPFTTMRICIRLPVPGEYLSFWFR
jgi:uncharacterized membrane protein